MYPPNSKLARLVDAAVEPLSLADAKNYLRVEIGDDDTLIADLITAARLQCEAIADRSFIATSWRLTLDFLPMSAGPFLGFPWPFGQTGAGGGGGAYGRLLANDGSVTLPMPPLIGLTALDYVDQGGTVRSLDVSPGSADVLVSPGTPGRIYPAFGRFFPLSQPRPAAVDITYTAGYGPDAAAVPRTYVQAIRMLTAHYYEHRTSNVEVPDAVASLIRATAGVSYA